MTDAAAQFPSRSSILFVCMGNICRSPIAEGVFISLACQRGLADRFHVDSCGTGGWHVGESPDPRASATAARYGVRLDHTARQFDPRSDPERFELILAMDAANLSVLRAAVPDATRTRLVREFDPGVGTGQGAPEVPDPYYGAGDGFDRVYHMLVSACGGLLDALLAESHPLLPPLRRPR